MDRAAVGIGKTKANIVHEDDENVGRACGQAIGLDAPVHGRFLERWSRHTRGRRRWKGQHRTVGGLRSGLAGQQPQPSCREDKQTDR